MEYSACRERGTKKKSESPAGTLASSSVRNFVKFNKYFITKGRIFKKVAQTLILNFVVRCVCSSYRFEFN